MTTSPLDAARFRKKPVEVEAMRLTDDAAEAYAIARWCGGRIEHAAKASDPTDVAVWLDIPTLEGVMKANVGDWIIKGVKGEFYPCKPDIFEATYEPAARASGGEGRAERPTIGDLLEAKNMLQSIERIASTHATAKMRLRADALRDIATRARRAAEVLAHTYGPRSTPSPDAGVGRMLARVKAALTWAEVHLSNDDPRCAVYGDWTKEGWNDADRRGQRCEESDCVGCGQLALIEFIQEARAALAAYASTTAEGEATG